ncbi:response regulator [Sulfurospirillum sp.]|uniref:response regulator n=1 Tax=Sulfurospirillum sp. TaxID=2053622 RepID=UPI002FDE0277
MVQGLQVPKLELEKGSILIIEDSMMFSKALKKGLSALGYHITLAHTLHDAIHTLIDHSFDLIILDLNLPDGEGEEIFKNLDIFKKLKIIVYTSDTDKDRRNEWFRYGVLRYLSKSDPMTFVFKEIDTVMKSLVENISYSILLVDDSRFICRQISELLQPRNYTVSIANDGKTARELFNEKIFDLIILDLELPDTTGEALLIELRKHQQSAKTPIFILTGQYDASGVGRLIKQGANEFFLKPFIAEELLLKIDFWIDYERTSKQNLYQHTILQEYKDAVDRSTIVSRTNQKGFITYVNDKFCQISGYTKEELLGQPHNLVRHPDMPKAVFQNLWETIQAGKSWEGIVKNRRKDGSHYWVSAVINPIIDQDGTIVEFMSIRTDITSIHNIHDSLKTQLKISEESFEDAYHMFKQYENAINVSTILTRTDLDGNITFANTNFYTTTGYTEAEVLGKNHSIIRHKDTPNDVFTDLWATLKAGKVWKGVFKNQKKDGTAYWVNSTILPILDKVGNPLEYMAIRREITEIIKLHEEIESTQQEVIYRMGEIAESRSKETGNHVRRVAEYSRLLALKLGFDKQEADLIATASPMHDIGKVGIPDAILLKPGKLDDAEWEIMRTHAMLGYTILQNSSRPLLQAAAIIAKEHHEKYNGTGYPLNISGANIHIYARIVAIADVFDALSHDRCYKKAWEDEAVFDFFRKEREEHFDPKLVDLFLDTKDEFLAIRDSLKDTIYFSA